METSCKYGIRCTICKEELENYLYTHKCIEFK